MKKHITSFVAVAGILTASADISNPGPTGTVVPEKSIRGKAVLRPA